MSAVDDAKCQRVDRLFEIEISNQADRDRLQERAQDISGLRDVVTRLAIPENGSANWIALKTRIETQRASKVIIYHGLELLKGSFTRLNGKFESGLTNVTAAFPSHATTSANTTFENDGDWEKISPIKPTLTLRDAIEEVNKNTVEERERARSASTELSGLDEQPPATLGVQSLFVPEQSPSLQARTRKRDRSRDRSRGHPRRSRSPRSPLESSYHQQTSRRSSRKYAPYGGPDNSPDLNRESSRGRSVSPARVSYRERRRFREPRNPRKHGILPARMSPRDSRSPRRNSRSLRRERSRPRGDNSLRPRKSY